MAMARGQFEGRSSSCLRKYRIFLIFVMTILCIQVYLAYVFITLDNNDRDSSKVSSGEVKNKQILYYTLNLPKKDNELLSAPFNVEHAFRNLTLTCI